MMKKLLFQLAVMLVAWATPSFADTARVDIDARGDGINLEVGKPSEGVTARNASWLQGDMNKQVIVVEARGRGDWQQASFSFTPDKTGKVLLQIKGEWRVASGSTGTLKQVWMLYDDFEVKNAELRNSGIDGGTDGWKLGGDAQYVADLGHAKPGCIKAWQGGQAVQELTVKAGQEVAIGFWFRRPDGQSGLRVFTIGHSFHANWLPDWLSQVEDLGGVATHEQLGASMLGGSRVIQHWQLPDEKNTAKAALKTGKVEVLTVSPMLSPDDGLDHFATLALEHNPNIRITMQEFWLPYDRLDCFGEKSYGELAKTLRNWEDPAIPDDDPARKKLDTAHFDVPTAEQLEKLHAPYFQKMDAYVVEENRKLGKQVIHVVPVGQAVVALRKKIIDGKVPGITKQSELFIDNLGHPGRAICALSAYCHYAVIYKRSPVGLGVPPYLAQEAAKIRNSEELNLLLQQLAWDAVTHHPLSGVSVAESK
jgi:hypothetical protein